jgi:catechol 2,3-dioxygenase-like lactoylglutathione lyase family enzyme
MAQLLVNIDVDDLDRGVRFYTEGLGLRVGRRFGGGAIELLGAEAPIYLLLNEAGTMPFVGATSLRDYGRHWTPVHLDFAVPDLEVAVERARRAGATSEGAISERAWGRMARLADPFGHGVCLLQLNTRGYDAIAT